MNHALRRYSNSHRTGLLLVLGLWCLPVAAHHSGAQFDQSNKVNVSGVVARMEWTNPHSRLYVDSTDEHGAKVQWEFELPSVNRLLRLGWTRHALQPGDRVTVTGARARSFPNIAAAMNVMDANGTKLFVGSPDGGPAS